MTFEDYHSMTRWIRENGPLPPGREIKVGERVILDGEVWATNPLRSRRQAVRLLCMVLGLAMCFTWLNRGRRARGQGRQPTSSTCGLAPLQIPACGVTTPEPGGLAARCRPTPTPPTTSTRTATAPRHQGHQDGRRLHLGPDQDPEQADDGLRQGRGPHPDAARPRHPARVLAAGQRLPRASATPSPARSTSSSTSSPLPPHPARAEQGEADYRPPGRASTPGCRAPRCPPSTPRRSFHTYWAERSPDMITIGVDDMTTAVFTPDSLPDGATWVSMTSPCSPSSTSPLAALGLAHRLRGRRSHNRWSSTGSGTHRRRIDVR